MVNGLGVSVTEDKLFRDFRRRVRYVPTNGKYYYDGDVDKDVKRLFDRWLEKVARRKTGESDAENKQ